MVNITPIIVQLLAKHPSSDGLIHLFLPHTTAALTAAYIEDDMDLNLIGAYEIMITKRLPNASEHSHHMGHLPAHIVGSLLGPSLVVPVKDNKLKLGAFQNIVLIELNGPREREIIIEYQEV